MSTRYLETYLKYTPELIKQLDNYYMYNLSINQQNEIDAIAKEYLHIDQQKENLPPKDYTPIYRRIAMFNEYNPLGKLKTGGIQPQSIYAINSRGDRLYLIKSLGIQKDQDVYLGYVLPSLPSLPPIPDNYIFDVHDLQPENMRVVKWSETEATDVDIEDEMNNWESLIQIGIPNPDVEFDYTLWGFPVMVMSYMEPIDPKDWRSVGHDILDCLQILHKIGVHNDIKPDNILRHPITGKYVLMDMESLTNEQLYYGYQRKAWSPNWTSQVKGVNDQITNPKYDLIELGYTLHYLCRPGLNKELIRSIVYNDRVVYAFNAYAIQLDERDRYLPDKVYQDLHNILDM